MVEKPSNPKLSITVQSFKIHTHSRKLGVSVAAFLAHLRQLSEQSEFAAAFEDIVARQVSLWHK